MFVVYILYSQTLDRFYVGYTNDIKRRLKEHNRKKGKYTDNGIPWELKYIEKFTTKQEARKRELYIKNRKSRTYVEQLVNDSS